MKSNFVSNQKNKNTYSSAKYSQKHSKNAYKKKYYNKASENKEDVTKENRSRLKKFKRTVNKKKRQKRVNIIDERNKYDFIYLGDSEDLFLAFPVKTWFFNRFLTRKSKKCIHKFLMDNRKTFGFNFKEFLNTFRWYYKNTQYNRIKQCGFVSRFCLTTKKCFKSKISTIYFVIRINNECKQQKFIFDTKYLKNIFIIDNSLFKTEKIPIEHERVRRFEKIYISHDPLMVSEEFWDYLVDKWCIVDHFNKKKSVFVFSKK